MTRAGCLRKVYVTDRGNVCPRAIVHMRLGTRVKNPSPPRLHGGNRSEQGESQPKMVTEAPRGRGERPRSPSPRRSEAHTVCSGATSNKRPRVNDQIRRPRHEVSDCRTSVDDDYKKLKERLKALEMSKLDITVVNKDDLLVNRFMTHPITRTSSSLCLASTKKRRK